MFDVFTEQLEVLIKDGIANLYWYKGDLQKAWLRAGVDKSLATRISSEKDADGNVISKRKQWTVFIQSFGLPISISVWKSLAIS
jgi:hypothetical protein